MPNNELPSLSAWHRVPVGTTIPKGTPYAYVSGGVVDIALDGYCEDIVAPADAGIRYTELPIAPSLPTEEGATIVVSSDEGPPHILLTREGGRWVNRYGVTWYVVWIHAWAPVTIGEVVVVRP